ncbi:MAG: leucine-rich repeat domain-containing protein [Bacteroidales bacterium]|nr:leucine-rich repeat domain-containing protein [Bacteroidales bacterium]
MMSLLSGNTFGGYLRSDGRSLYPMHPRISFIQKCKKCEKYSLFSQWKECDFRSENDYGGTTGRLSYEETKEAYRQLLQHDNLNDRDKLTMCLEYIHAYNDYFHNPQDIHCENNDREIFMEASGIAIKLLGTDRDSRITKGELLREREDFKAAREVLLTTISEDVRWIVEPILYFCNSRTRVPFVLMENGKKVDWTTQPDFYNIVNGEIKGVKEQRRKEYQDYISTLDESRRKTVDTDFNGGIYVDHGKILTKVVDECTAHYEIGPGTIYISEYACYKNKNLKSLLFPSSLRSIGANAFYGCRELECCSLTPDGLLSVISIGEKAFMNCKKLEGFTSSFLRDVRFIGKAAFSGMDRLSHIELPEGLLEIPEFCFGCDTVLCDIEIPSTVRLICDGAFFDSGLISIAIPEGVKHYGKCLFSMCRRLENVILPKTITNIPERMFFGCESLGYLEIPSLVSLKIC